METSLIENRLMTWAAAACREWGYPELPNEYQERLRARLPRELMEALELGIQNGSVIEADHRFTLKGLSASKGPYAWFSRSPNQVPAPNWEYFVQVATYARLHDKLVPQGYTLVFEDDLMDIAVYKDGELIVCCEVKEKASQLEPLLSAIRAHEDGFDPALPDRHNDGLRKAKYIMKSKPKYLALVAIGREMQFRVHFPSESSFVLTEEEIPIW